MTASEMEYEFNVGFDSISNFSSPGFEKREISLFLSQAQQNVYLDIINNSAGVNSSASKEELNKINIANLISTSSLLTALDNNPDFNVPNGHFVYLPVDFFFPLNEYATIAFKPGTYEYYHIDKYPERTKSNVIVRPYTRLEYNNVKNHIRKPSIDLVWRFEYQRTDSTLPISGTNLMVYELVGDTGYYVTNYKVSYYKRLPDIDVTNAVSVASLLDANTHRLIVRDAITIAAAAIKDNAKYQMSVNETQKLL